jgi:hypothetical protein
MPAGPILVIPQHDRGIQIFGNLLVILDAAVGAAA